MQREQQRSARAESDNRILRTWQKKLCETVMRERFFEREREQNEVRAAVGIRAQTKRLN